MPRSPERGPRPLLRSPPFPWVDADRAAVSRRGAPAALDPLEGDPAAVCALIAAARVGGSFWAPPPALDGVTAVLAPAAPADMPAMLARLRADERRRPLALSARGGEIDPWPILASPLPLVADPASELAALATIAGRPWRAVGDAPPPDRAALAVALTRATRYRDPFEDRDATLAEAVTTLALWRQVIDANRAIAVACGVTFWKRETIARFLWAPRPRPLRFARTVRGAVAAAARGGGAVAAWPSRIGPELAARAEARGVPLVRIEDGFIRSIGLGSALFPPFSIVVDRRGIYYDPSRPSDLETLLETAAIDPPLHARAAALAQTIIAARVTKYGGIAAAAPPPRDAARRLILVPGQVGDDLSVRLGGGAVGGNLALLAAVRAQAPDAEIWFRPHPDVDAGHRGGAIPDAEALRLADRVVRGGDLLALLEAVDEVHTLTSLTGFEALLRGVPVTVHGAPFYAGWGLTTDRGPVPARRTRRHDRAALVAATLILYPRYLDPLTGLPCPPEVVVRRFAAGIAPPATLLRRLRRWQGRWMLGRRS